MTPLENGLLQRLGFGYLDSLEQLSIYVFFYGASSSLAVQGLSTSPLSGVFLVLFSASVVIFMFVFSFRKAAYFSTRPDPPNVTGDEDFPTA